MSAIETSGHWLSVKVGERTLPKNGQHRDCVSVYNPNRGETGERRNRKLLNLIALKLILSPTVAKFATPN